MATVIRSRVPTVIPTVETRLAADDLLGAFVSNSSVAMIVVDDAGIVRHWNRSAEDLLGWRAHETVGAVNPAAPHREPAAGVPVSARLAADVTVARRERWRRKDGSWLDLSISSAPLRDAAGNTTASLAFLEETAPPSEDGRSRRPVGAARTSRRPRRSARARSGRRFARGLAVGTGARRRARGGAAA